MADHVDFEKRVLRMKAVELWRDQCVEWLMCYGDVSGGVFFLMG